MDPLLQDPIFIGLAVAIFVVIGLIIGWSLRAEFPEKKLAKEYELSKQNMHTLARLYNHLRQQHDVREADLRKTSLELERLHGLVANYERDKAASQAAAQQAAIRLEQSENRARLLHDRIRTLEGQENGLRARNESLAHELARLQEELHAWKTLQQSFAVLHQRLLSAEKTALDLDAENRRLRDQLVLANQQVEALERELARLASQKRRGGAPSAGGRQGDTPEQDDLKIIHGIAAPLEKQLRAMGVISYNQISRWDDETIIATAKALGISPGKIYKEDWVGQAQRLA